MDEDLDASNALKEQWMLGQIPLKDGILFVRLNASAKLYIGHPKLAIRLGFAIPFNEEPEAGVPNPDENQAMDALEDTIREVVTTKTAAIHVLTLTAPDVKELVFYITKGTDISALHELIKSKSKTHEIQCIAVRDPRWDVYRDFLPQEQKDE